MKKLLSTLLLLAGSLQMMATNTDSLFTLANQHYAAADYSKAIVLYEEIESTDQIALSLFFNMGNAYYQNGNISKAILYYERALLVDHEAEAVLHNLAIAQQRINKIEPMPELFFISWWKSWTLLLSANAWSISIIIFACLSSFLIYRYSLLRSPANFWNSILGTTIFLIALFSQQAADSSSKKQFVILQEDATSEVRAGNKLLILQKGENQSELQAPDGNTLWVSNAHFIII